MMMSPQHLRLKALNDQVWETAKTYYPHIKAIEEGRSEDIDPATLNNCILFMASVMLGELGQRAYEVTLDQMKQGRPHE